MRNEAWANYIKEKRKEKHFTRRQLAGLAKIDPSYVTLIERDGFIPKRDKVISLASVMDADVGEMLLMAGYSPYIESQEALNGSFIKNTLFVPELFELVKYLSEQENSEQTRAVGVIKTCLEAVGFNISNSDN